MPHRRYRLHLILKGSSELDFLHGFLCKVLPVLTNLLAAFQCVLIQQT